MTVYLEIQRRVSRSASKSGRNDGINMLKLYGSILKQFKGNVSFTLILYYTFVISLSISCVCIKVSNCTP